MIASVTFLSVLTAKADDEKSCSYINLATRSRLGITRDQGNIGWCYAHVAADIVTRATRQPISVADMAVEYNHAFKTEGGASTVRERERQERDATFADNGFTSRAIHNIEKKGFCLEKNFRSYDGASKDLIPIHKIALDLKKTYSGKDAETVKKAYAEIKVIVPQMNIIDFSEVFLNSNSTNFYDNLREKACAPRIHTDRQFSSASPKTKESLEMVINSQLEAGSPLGIAIETSCMKSNGPVEKKSTGHVVSIIGRKYVKDSNGKGSCQYILRNSWGLNDGQQGKRYMTAERLHECFRRNLTFMTRTSRPSGELEVDPLDTSP